MNKKIVAIVLVLLVVAAGIGYEVVVKEEKGITATGTIEVTVADVVPKLNGYMTGLTIDVGDKVAVGQVIARIKRPDLESQLLADQSGLAKANAQMRDLVKGPRAQEQDQARANLAAAQSVYDKAKVDLERYRDLSSSGAIPRQQLDAAQSSYDVAYNSLLASRAQQSLINEGNRPDVIEGQRMEVKRAEAVVSLTQSALADTVVYSPLNGTVLTRNYVNGEYLNPGSAIATIGDPNDCWVKIYISTEQLGLIKLDQQVDVKIDAYPERNFLGIIKEISQKAEFTPRQSITKRERANLVFYVKVKIDNSEGILKAGMPADVVIQ